MTDITELAQREKFEAWVMTQICISKSTMEGLRTADGYRNTTLSGTNYNRMWNCWKAAGAELVEALESEKRICSTWRKTAKSTGEKLEKAQERIAELESRTVKLPAERFCPAEYAGSQLWSETEVWNKAITACADALRADGIKVEVE